VKNTFLRESTALDISGRISRVLRGLGNPEPPLDLLEVRELLNLDRVYYRGERDGVLAESISRIKIAGKQVLARPTLLLDAIRKLDLKALYIPDKKRILLDETLPPIKHRWNEAHEIGHSLLPWHGEMTMGDDLYSLTPGCQEQLEAEANYTGGQLLFLGPRFASMANDTKPSIEVIRSLKELFGNTITNTLWHYVESTHVDLPMAGVVTVHPHRAWRKDDFDSKKPCRYFVRSPAFATRFATITEVTVFSHIQSYCGSQKGGPLGDAEVPLADVNGTEHVFYFETFYNRFEALTLIVYLRARPSLVVTAS